MGLTRCLLCNGFFCVFICTLSGLLCAGVPAESPGPPSAASGGPAVSGGPVMSSAGPPARRAGSSPPAAARRAASPNSPSHCVRGKQRRRKTLLPLTHQSHKTLVTNDKHAFIEAYVEMSSKEQWYLQLSLTLSSRTFWTSWLSFCTSWIICFNSIFSASFSCRRLWNVLTCSRAASKRAWRSWESYKWRFFLEKLWIYFNRWRNFTTEAKF